MPNRLETALKNKNPNLFGKLEETEKEVRLLLQKYSVNFPQYTDHSIDHTRQVFDYASDLLSDNQIDSLNDDEIYVLSMACYLHDIGMCIPEEKIHSIKNTEEILDYKKNNPKKPIDEFIRDIHHILSYKFIVHEKKLLKIPDEKYAKAIGLVAQGHRKVDLGNIDVYKPRFSVKSGKDFVCLPYLAAIIRLADELDITNIRTPRLLTKYYMPDNDKSINEWNKHISTTIVNLFDDDDTIRYEVICTDQYVYGALQEQFQKLEETIFYCQKIVKNISNTGKRKFELIYTRIEIDYVFKGFDPKGIKFSFNVNNVVNAFIGENLYDDELAALREVIQNSIDTCRYKKVLLGGEYLPELSIEIEDNTITISDNGLGMDEFIVENYFGKLASSYYQEDSVKKDYEAIGQFGIGVFSYFLIAEYIDIETKTANSSALKFRIDKDPNNYFHFFEETNRKKAGTSIKLYLKDDFENDSNLIEEFISNTFRYIEFPISIKLIDGNVDIIKKELAVNTDELLKNSLKYQYLQEINKVSYYNYFFDNDRYEGCISLIYDIDKTFQGFDKMFGEDLYGKGRHHRNVFNVSQKGVFVSSLSDYRYPTNCICNLNLKSKININLSRHGFSQNDTIRQIIKEIEEDLIKTFFKEHILNLKKETLPQITYDFFALQSNFTSLNDLLFLKVIQNNKSRIVQVIDFIKEKHDSFKLIDAVTTKYEENDLIIQRPIKNEEYNLNNDLLFYESVFADYYYSEYNILDKDIFLVFHKKEDQALNENGTLNKLLDNVHYFRKFYNKDIIGMNIAYYSAFVNINHQFIIELNQKLNLVDQFKNSKKIKRIIEELVALIRRNIEGFGDKKDNIISLNRLIKSLEPELVIDYKFTNKDF
jgi:HSP90 family molecular chaperone